MSAATFTILLLIWIWVLHQRKNKADRVESSRTKEFWNQERLANGTRRRDISSLPYLSIPVDSLPMHNETDPQLLEYYETIKNLSETKILNLGNETNTELKLKYGSSNLDQLTEYEANFTTLIRTIANWGAYLLSKGATADAQTVLEYGITCGSDIKSNYVLLAQIYKDCSNTEKITSLIEQAQALTTLMKSSILKSLDEIKNSI